MAERRPADRVGLVGTGMVGASFAYALMQSGVADELILIDADSGRAEGEAMDLNHGLPFVRPMRIAAGGFGDLTGCDVVVVTAGANQRPGQTRLDLLRHNAEVIRSVVPKIVEANPDGVILVASNPVDILTQIAADLAGRPDGHVLGSGTILDTARFRFLLAEHYGVDPRSVHAYIVGEHGDTELAVWSLANIAGVRLGDFVGPGGRGYDRAALDAILENTRTAAYEIIRRKRATYYAIGLALLTVIEAILRDQRTVLTVSTPLKGRLGIDGIAASLPSIVGRGGVEEVLNIPMTPDEVERFRHSEATLKERQAEVAP
jgi:L-lactate dehydrogenase